MKTSEVLNKAADLIEERGWASGSGWYPEAGSTEPVCLEGALTAILGLRVKWKCPAWRAVAEHLSTRNDVQIQPANGLPIVWGWNDAPGRTVSEVLEVLRAAAVIEAVRETADERQSVTA